MVEWLTLFLLSFAVSLDSFTAGFTFGLRKITIPIKSLISIGCVTAIVFLVAMLIGERLAAIFSPHIADLIGGVLFIGIGLWVVYQFVRDHRKNSETASDTNAFIFKWEIKSLGIVIQILKNPNRADMDSSGDIKGIEAIILGTALSLDAFGAGIGAAIFGFTPILTAAFTATMSSLFLFIGTKSGYFLSRWKWIDKIAFVPGLILIMLGVLKIS
ncbi:sporulation membrane protein YtaF [Salinibacillus xinjiangensis]|uniref:Sporulation membrane protein YtaF n=1 Tax=Salinibacillus xinjiangensis TaxID=1229268 RepID=A0A6G1X9R6_9BACI|nr:sporulation membrane protein YtaF [Salinibacillus xinjiangensis]MRG87669.1 sporulation membrane protein YtaF [Salinibacillus xinjiangensis]